MTRKHDSLFSDHTSPMTRQLIQALTEEGLLYLSSSEQRILPGMDDSAISPSGSFNGERTAERDSVLSPKGDYFPVGSPNTTHQKVSFPSGVQATPMPISL